MRLAVKLFIVILILGGGGYAVWRHYYAEDPQHAAQDLRRYIPDEDVKVTRGDIRKIVNATGKVLPNQDVSLKCKASGQIVEMPFNISDRVKKGDLLVKLDPVDEERNTRKAQVALDVSISKLDTAKVNFEIAKQTLETDRAKVASDITSAEVKLNDLKTTLNRAEQLFAKDLVSREELDKAEVAFKQGELDLKQTKLKLDDLKTSEMSLQLKKSDIDQANAQVETNRLQLLDAQQRLKDTTLLAPLDGVITTVSARVGQVVSSGTSSTTSGTDIMDLTDLSRLFAEINVDESDVAGIREEMPARIVTDSSPDKVYEGKVLYIAPKGVRSRGVVSFTVRVEILAKESPALRPEMSTNVDVILDQRKNVLTIPVPAVIAENGKYYVQVVKPAATVGASAAPVASAAPAVGGSPAGTPAAPTRQTEKREVKLGLSDGGMVEVVDGVTEGETLVITLSAEESRWVSKALDKDNMAKWSTAPRRR